MVFIKWLADMISALWHVLDVDLLGIGVNINVLFVSIIAFGFFINFIRTIGGMGSGGLETMSSLFSRESKSEKSLEYDILHVFDSKKGGN